MKNNLATILTLLIFFCGGQLLAQTQEIIYLKDGSSIRGTLVSEDEQRVIWKLTNGSELVITTAEVNRIKRVPKFTTLYDNGKTSLTKGWYGTVSLGYMQGDSDFAKNRTGHAFLFPHLTAGYRLNNRLGIGLGAGLNIYDDLNVLPVYLDIRGTIVDRSTALYYKLNGGYGFSLNPDDGNEWDGWNNGSGGLYAHPALGVKFNDQNQTAFFVEAGYVYQRSEISSKFWEITQQWTYRRISLSIGIEF